MRLRRELLGDVAQEGVEHITGAARQRGHAELDFYPLAAAANGIELDALTEDGPCPVPQEARDAVAMAAAEVIRHDQAGERSPDRLLARPAEDGLGLRIPFEHVPGVIHLDEGVKSAIDDVAGELLALAGRLLRELQRRDVDTQASDAATPHAPLAHENVAAVPELDLDHAGRCAVLSHALGEPFLPGRVLDLVAARCEAPA